MGRAVSCPGDQDTIAGELVTAEAERSQLDTKGVARMLGVSPETVTRYRSADRAKYGFPEPDGHIGGRPWWWSTTIEEWRDARPGMGAGAGRPRKTPSD